MCTEYSFDRQMFKVVSKSGENDRFPRNRKVLADRRNTKVYKNLRNSARTVEVNPRNKK